MYNVEFQIHNKFLKITLQCPSKQTSFKIYKVVSPQNYQMEESGL
jgi:hypothetical protein